MDNSAKSEETGSDNHGVDEGQEQEPQASGSSPDSNKQSVQDSTATPPPSTDSVNDSSGRLPPCCDSVQNSTASLLLSADSEEGMQQQHTLPASGVLLEALESRSLNPTSTPTTAKPPSADSEEAMQHQISAAFGSLLDAVKTGSLSLNPTFTPTTSIQPSADSEEAMQQQISAAFGALLEAVKSGFLSLNPTSTATTAKPPSANSEEAMQQQISAAFGALLEAVKSGLLNLNPTSTPGTAMALSADSEEGTQHNSSSAIGALFEAFKSSFLHPTSTGSTLSTVKKRTFNIFSQENADIENRKMMKVNEEAVADLIILRGILDYYAKNRIYPFDNFDALEDFHKNWLHREGGSSELADKIQELKDRYKKVKKKGGQLNLMEMDLRDKHIYQYSKAIWDIQKDDEVDISILKGFLDYYSKNGEYPLTNFSALRDFSKNWLNRDGDPSIVSDKIQELKEKYMKTVKAQGENPSLEPHYRVSFLMSKQIWGGGSQKDDGNGGGGTKPAEK